MVYLFIGERSIKLLVLSKTLLGQYNISFFQKKHETTLLEQGKIKNIDLLASAVKEALTLAHPAEVKDREFFLILPNRSFHFSRYEVPPDISDSVVLSYVKDKARSEVKFDVEGSVFDYLLAKRDKESKVLFFAQEQSNYEQFEEVFKLLGAKIKGIIPESLAYFTLFKKTLRENKKEKILYVHYDKEGSSGYLFDSLGPLKKEAIKFDKPLVDSLKSNIKEIEEEDIKLDRLILSGKASEDVRQDLFTKKVGVWTNPLKKIVVNFYKDYLKLLVLEPKTKFSFLEFDVCLGAFIFNLENRAFSLLKKKRSLKKAVVKIPKFKFSLPSLSRFSNLIKSRDLIIFVVSFVVSFSVIFYFPKISQLANKPLSLVPNPTITPTPKPTAPPAAPTPSVKREDLKIKLLNGVGISGKAGKVKDDLQAKGWGEILVGNADNFDYEETEVQVKEDKKGAVDLLREDLKTDATLGESSTLSEDEAADLVLIIGADFK